MSDATRTRPLGNGGKPEDDPLERGPLTGTARQIEKRLEDTLGGIAIAFQMSGDTFCATVVAERGGELATAWARLASRNAGVRRVLERMLAGGEWGEVVFATLPVVALIGWHHGLIPDEVGTRLAVAYGLVPEQGEPAGDPAAPYPEDDGSGDADGD